MFNKEVKFYDVVSVTDSIRCPKRYFSAMNGGTCFKDMRGTLVLEDLSELKNARFLSPWIEDDALEKAVTFDMARGVSAQLGSLILNIDKES